MLDPIDIKYFKLCCPDLGKETTVDVSARCPICGDSKTNINKKRLHLYQKQGLTLVKCFNCNIHNNMYNFLKLYFPSELHNYKREKFFDKLDDFKNYIKEPEQKLDLVETPKDFRTIDLEPYLGELTQEALEYLRSRNLSYDRKYGEWYFGIKDVIINDKTYKIKDKIVIPFYYNNKIYGFYSRSIYDKDFVSFNLNNEYKIWNWFGIDKNEPVYIFEGIFDALSSGKTNIIALCGLDITDNRLKELQNPVFCLDNDTTGIKRMIKYHNLYPNAKYLIYPKDFCHKDLNSALQAGVSMNFEYQSGMKALMKLKELL